MSRENSPVRDRENDEVMQMNSEERRQMQEQLRDLEKELQQYEQEKKNANEQLRKAEEKIKKFEQEERNCNKRLEELTEQIQRIKDEMARLQVQLNELRTEQEHLQDERDNQQQLLDQQEDLLRKQTEELEKLQEKLREYEATLENLAAEHEKLEKAKQELDARIAEINRQVQQLEQEIKEIQNKIQQLQQEIQRIEQEIERIEEDLQKTLRDIQINAQELERTREKLMQLERQQDLLQIEVDRIEDLIIRIENVIEMKRNQKEEFEALKQTLQAQINEVKQQHAQIQAEVQRLQQQVQAEKASLQPLIDQETQLKTELANLQKAQQVLIVATEVLKQNLGVKQTQLAQSKQQVENLDRNLQEKERTFNQMQEEKKTMEEKLKQDKDGLTRTQNDFHQKEIEQNQCRATLDQEKNNLQSRQAELCNEQRKQTQAESNLRQQEQKTKQAEQQVKDCQQALQAADQAVNQAKQTVESTQKDVQSAEEQLKIADIALQALLALLSLNPLAEVVGLFAAKAAVRMWQGTINEKKGKLQQNQAFLQKKIQEQSNAKNKLTQAQKTHQDEKSNLTKRQEELQQQKQRVQTSTERVQQQKTLVGNLSTKHQQIQNQTQQLKTQINNQTKQVQQEETNIKTQTTRANVLNTEINQVKTQKGQVTQQCATLSNEIGKLNEQHQGQSKNLEMHNQKIQEHQQKQNALTSQIEQKRGTIQNLEKQITSTANEEARLRGQLTNMEENIRMLNKSVSELENDKRVQQKLLKDNQQKLSRLETESSRMENDIRKLTHDAEKLEQDQTRLERELKTQQRQILEKNKDRESLKFELQQKQDNITRLKSEKNDLEQEKGRLNTAMENNRIEQSNIKKKVGEMNRKVTQEERTKQNLEQKVNETRNQLKSATKELDRMNKRVNELDKQSKTLQQKQDTLTDERDSIADKKSTISSDLSNARMQYNDSERQVQDSSGRIASKELLQKQYRRRLDGKEEKRSETVYVREPTRGNRKTDDDQDYDRRRQNQNAINLMTRKVSVYDYLSMKKGNGGEVSIDMKNLGTIRNKFAGMTDEKSNRMLLKQLAEKLNILDDEKNLELLRSCVDEDSPEAVKTEICQKYYDDQQRPSPAKTTTSAKETPTKPTTITIDEINCQIQMKGNQDELNKFFKHFLLVSISSDSSVSLEKNVVHLLNDRCVLYLFIKKQLTQRGVIDFGRERQKFRLVESISLNDEFDTWDFDHFHSLFDLFLTRPNNQPFPPRWELIHPSKLTYQILPNDQSHGDDQRVIQRPSTKSLEKFIEDICLIEDNGMGTTWIDLLREEDITTYAHLTNLNQKEWETIRKLSMNALKTIKTYIDREKQTAEDSTTTRKNRRSKRKNESESELLAKIHMIKLYFNHSLKDEEDLHPLPKLDFRCVNKAFEEMRRDYEDDGLFGEMIQFFLPLTVTEKELILDSKEIQYNSEEKRRTRQEYEKEIEKFIQINVTIIGKIERRKATLGQIKQERERSFRALQNDLKEMKRKDPMNYIMKKTDLEKRWSEEENTQNDRIKEFKQDIEHLDSELKSNEAIIKERKNLLSTIIDDLNNEQMYIDDKLVKPHRGFIMYGPPGTGKSHIMSQLAKKIGIAMLGPPLAAGELERPLVGQSEAVILDLCSRGNRLPYLMCCVSIDEIDSLAPRRDEDSSEGKVAKLSVLLSVLEGIKDVPNLMFFSATNRLHMMDEAFLRRMSGKFFVGRPSSQARKRILNVIPRNMLDPTLREKLASATTNFSGAALSALNRSIAVHFIARRREDKNYRIEYEEALLQADQTARQYQIFLGLDTLPRLLKRNLDSTKQFGTSKKAEEIFHLKDDCYFTGKIIISLANRSARIEYIDREKGVKRVYEDRLTHHEESVQQLLERITNYGNDRNVQLLQLIDLNLLSSKGAYDEKKIFETLKERYDECMEYKRSMIIYDLDSLIGVNTSESESSMGTSTSSSVVHQALYIYVTSRFREAVIETNNKLNVEKWAIAVVRDSFLLKKFSQDVQFPRTDREEEEYKEDQRKENELIKCVKCRDYFIENDNKMGNCTYHDGFVYDNFSLELTKYTPSVAADILNREEFEAARYPQKKEEIERRKGRFKYICCDSAVQASTGSSAGGCKKSKHAVGKVSNKSRRSRTLTKESIDEWETFCLENDEYNERWCQLFSNRSKSSSK